MTEERITELIALGEKHKFTLAQPPKYAGGYRMGGNAYYTQFNLTKKPCWLHRKMSKLLLGLEWKDNV